MKWKDGYNTLVIKIAIVEHYVKYRHINLKYLFVHRSPEGYVKTVRRLPLRIGVIGSMCVAGWGGKCVGTEGDSLGLLSLTFVDKL